MLEASVGIYTISQMHQVNTLQ